MKLPGVAFEVALTTNELVAVPPDARAIGEDMERFTPDGAAPTQVVVIVMEEARPLTEDRVIGTVTYWPWFTATEGVAETEKSGIAEVVVAVDVTMASVDEPESPVGLPVAVIVYEVGETLLTVK